MSMFLTNIAAGLVGILIVLLMWMARLVGGMLAAMGGMIMLLALCADHRHMMIGLHHGGLLIAISALIFLVQGAIFPASPGIR